MSRNGSGSYSLPSGNPVVPSTVISSTWANNTLSDIATALTQSIANDGQTAPVANLPMAAFRHTNVANALNRNEYAAAGQVQDSSLQWLTSVAGTNTITASITPSPSAYTAGQTFRFVAAGANTGAATLNINGLGAKSIFKSGTGALVGGDIASGGVYEVVYDGTNFQLNNAEYPSGSLIGIRVLTASGNYTETVGTKSIVWHLLGGGGAGGGTPTTAAGQTAIGSGGASGGYCIGRSTSGFSGAAFTIGAGGTGVSGAAGNNGGNSTFQGATASGGQGGRTDGPSGPSFVSGSPSVGGAASGGLINVRGSNGGIGFSISTANASIVGGSGADSPFGSGAGGVVATGSTQTASGFGSGGAGVAVGVSAGVTLPGTNGTPGVLIIYEYA